MVEVERFSFISINTKDSCICIYIGENEVEELKKMKFVIYNQKELQFYYEDNSDFIKAKYTGNKQVVINGKIIIIESYWRDGPELSDLLYFCFTKKYGLIFMKFVGAERKLIKFSQEESEIKDLINAIKEDTEFYEWGGREPIYPPTD